MQIINNTAGFKSNTSHDGPSVREIALELVDATRAAEKASKFEPGSLMHELILALTDALRDLETM